MIFDTRKNDIATADAQRTTTTVCVTYLSFDVFGSGLCLRSTTTPHATEDIISGPHL